MVIIFKYQKSYDAFLCKIHELSETIQILVILYLRDIYVITTNYFRINF